MEINEKKMIRNVQFFNFYMAAIFAFVAITDGGGVKGAYSLWTVCIIVMNYSAISYVQKKSEGKDPRKPTMIEIFLLILMFAALGVTVYHKFMK